MYRAVLGDGRNECVVEAVRLTYSGAPPAPAARDLMALRLSRLERGVAATVFVTRVASEDDAGEAGAQLLMLDRLPRLLVESPFDRTTFDAWSANALTAAARPAIGSFATRRGGEREAVIPWLDALIATARRARSSDIRMRLVLAARPCRPEQALVRDAAALAADPDLPHRLPAGLVAALRARLARLPQFGFLVDSVVFAPSPRELADLDRLYRDELAARTGLSAASALALDEGCASLVPGVSLHGSYLDASRDQGREMLSRGLTKAELAGAVLELLTADAPGGAIAAARAAEPDEPPPSPSGIAVRPRDDPAYYRLPQPTKADDFLFVSYRQKNLPALADVLAHLESIGAAYWYDRALELSSEWDAEIERRINGCRAFVAVLSNAYFDSKICRREFKYADFIGKPLVPLAVEPLNPSGGLALSLASLQIAFLSDPQIRDFIARACAGAAG
jgi:hypothetical protein